jgi:spore germination protein
LKLGARRSGVAALVIVLSGSLVALTAAMTRPAAASPPPHVFAFLSHAGGRQLAQLRRVGRRISVVAPNWYGLDLRTGAVAAPSQTATVLRQARRVGAGVWPVVNARASGGVSLTNRSVARRVTRAIVGIGTTRGYAGVTIDIEDLSAGDRTAYSALVAHVAAALRRHGRRLAVYAPGVDGVGSGAAYDWSSLARSASLLLVSTYASGVIAPTPGPASSSTSFAAAAQRAAAVSPRTVAPPLAAVGYSWPVAGGPARILSAQAAAQRRASCHAAVTAADGAASFICDGREVYYPTAGDLRGQVRAARDRGIRWIGLFSLGREPLGFWNGLVTAR